MAVSIKDLVRDLTPEEVLADLLEIARALGLSLTADQPGEPAVAILTIFSRQISRLWNAYIVKAIRAGFLDYAEGPWLTLLAWAVYWVLRREATFATGSITLENRNVGAPFTFVAGDIRVKNSATGKTYTNTSGGFLAAWSGTGAYPTVTLTFQADEVGSESSAAIGEIATYPTTLVVGPALVFVQSNTALIGQDEEDDDALRERCRLSVGPLSPAGAKKAYEFVALSVRKDANGNPVMPWEKGYVSAQSLNVTRVRVVDVGQRTVKVWLASAGGAASGNTSTPGSDVYIVNAAIQIWAVPVGILAQVFSAIELPVTWTVTVYVDLGANVTASVAQAAVVAALTKYGQKLPIGGQRLVAGGQGYVFADEVKAKASESIEGIYRATMSGGDVEMGDNEVAVPTISVAANVVSQ